MNRFARGDEVEVLSEGEIRATLDGAGEVDGLPFMPEMLRYCGRRFRVARRADRFCVEGIGDRTMDAAVFLEDVRCDGAAHDQCQRNCLIFWKEKWLRPANGPAKPAPVIAASPIPEASSPFKGENGVYYCQSTQLVRATEAPAKSLSAAIGLLLADLKHKEISKGRFAWMVGLALVNKARAVFGYPPLGLLAGRAAVRSKGDLDLKSGDKVAVRPLTKIQESLDAAGKNYGLSFDPEMKFYRGTYEVDQQVDRIILETTGKMRTLSHTVTLKGVTCQGLCAKNCPRANMIFWREIWLDKLDGEAEAPRG